jgi:GNAT superfamily N-acetyltransferase
VPDQPLFVIEKLTATHGLDGFNSGKPPLDVWLKRFARVNVQNDSAGVYVAHRRDYKVAGYYALTAGNVAREEAPKRIAHGLAAHPIGVIVLARLAVDVTEQGKGLGAALLRDALLRIEQAADTIGVRAVVVQAIDEVARTFYLRYGFAPAAIDELRLMLLMKDLRAFLRKASG